MAHARDLLQKMKVVSGAQCMGRLAAASPGLMIKSPEGRGHLLKVERIGQSAAAG